MRRDRLAVWSIAGIILLLTVATGPSLQVISVPEGGFGSANPPGEGHATVTVIEAPSNATLEAGSYADLHYLRVPSAAVAVSGVTGSPLLTISIDIQTLGYTGSSVFTVVDRGDGPQTYQLDTASIESAQIDHDSYRGILRIVLRDDRGRTVLYEEPITVEVRE